MSRVTYPLRSSLQRVLKKMDVDDEAAEDFSVDLLPDLKRESEEGRLGLVLGLAHFQLRNHLDARRTNFLGCRRVPDLLPALRPAPRCRNY